MSVDLSEPIRSALVGAASITSQLAAYKGSYPIFTRRPAPTDVTFPIIMVSPDIASTDRDGINYQAPVLERDIAVYGQNDTPAHYRAVESIAYAVRALFHRRRLALTVPGWGVTNLLARGPIAAPTDDEQSVGRLVSLTVFLSKDGMPA